jgi:small subunit ribosomal protein S3
MGKKVNPLAMRPNFRQCQWFTSNKRHFAIKVLEDYQIRNLAKEVIGERLFVDINIERIGDKTNIVVNTHKPSIIIMNKDGKQALIEKYKKKLNDKIFNGRIFQVLISEVFKPETNCIIIAHNIAEQLEMRMSTKLCMKRAMNYFLRTVPNGGIRIICSGRVGGAEIARSEKVQEGKMPLASIKSNIQMAISVAHTVYGTVSVKVYTYLPKDSVNNEFKRYDNKDRKFVKKQFFNKGEKKYVSEKGEAQDNYLTVNVESDTTENKGDL